jgi:protein involved in plasmid replication-relaxation
MKASEGTRVPNQLLVISERKRRLAEVTWQLGLVSRDQGMVAVDIHSIPRMNAETAPMVKADILRRKEVPVCPGHGGAQSLYYSGRASAAVLAVSARELARRIRQVASWGVGEVERVRAENQVLIDIYAAIQQTSGSQLIGYRSELQLRQLFLDRGLVPDGWIAWRAGKRFNCYLEIDLGSEGLPIWRAKIDKYLQFARSGQHQELFGFTAFRVLVLAKSERRLANLRQMASAAGRMFLLATLSEVNPSSIFSPVWQTADGSSRIALQDA